MPSDDIDNILHQQEWSIFLETEDIDESGIDMDVALPDECKESICQRLNLQSIKSLKANLRFERHAVNKAVHVEGSITADVEQKCVVTMEPVCEQVTDEFEAWYSDKGQTVSFAKARRERMSAQEQDEQPVLEEEDDPESIVDGKIDIGELIVQYFSLALEPYPRIAGARGNFGDPLEDAPEDTYNNPFAALKDWKSSEKKRDK